MQDIIQFAVDVKDDSITEEKIEHILESAGIEVLGISFKARWREEDYWNCKPPFSCD